LHIEEDTTCQKTSIGTALDQRDQARAQLSAAIDLYDAMDITFWLPQAEAALAQVAGK
jgi:hypothetical protein